MNECAAIVTVLQNSRRLRNDPKNNVVRGGGETTGVCSHAYIFFLVIAACRHTLLRQTSTAGSFNLTVAFPSSTNQVKNFSMLSLSCKEREKNT